MVLGLDLSDFLTGLFQILFSWLLFATTLFLSERDVISLLSLKTLLHSSLALTLLYVFCVGIVKALIVGLFAGVGGLPYFDFLDWGFILRLDLLIRREHILYLKFVIESENIDILEIILWLLPILLRHFSYGDLQAVVSFALLP